MFADVFSSLSWADTAASTVGRAWGRLTSPLPRRLPILRLPLAPRKSLAGFLAGSATGALIAAGFWGWLGPLGNIKPVWTFEHGALTASETSSFGGWLGLGVISIVSGLVSGVAEALGMLSSPVQLPFRSSLLGRPWVLGR
jgi:diacylglycerol kinase (CTP)